MIVASSPAQSLLPGEAQGTDLLEDAEHWAAVYEELTHFLLSIRAAEPDRIGHFCARLEYWRHRRDELVP